MQKINLSRVGLTPLSPNETHSLGGGGFWGKLKLYTTTFASLANFMLSESIKIGVRSFAAGFQEGSKQ